jgi:hypothetical protein
MNSKIIKLKWCSPWSLRKAFRHWDRKSGLAALVLISPDLKSVIKLTDCLGTIHLLQQQFLNPIQSLPTVNAYLGVVATRREPYGPRTNMHGFILEYLDTDINLGERYEKIIFRLRQETLFEAQKDGGSIGEPELSLGTLARFKKIAEPELHQGLDRIKSTIENTQCRFDLIVSTNWMRRKDCIVMADPVITPRDLR